MSMGHFLRIEREKRLLTLDDITSACQMSKPGLSLIEIGKTRSPGFCTIVRFLSAIAESEKDFNRLLAEAAEYCLKGGGES
jgi:transcriptional regulator with XRE-family HTH domain